jgi:hypothetical protein
VLKKLILIVLVLSLSGCAMQTQYRPLGYEGGYSDMQLNINTYKVSFSGNTATSHEQVQNMLLRRCAEVTRNKGYKYFVIVSSNTEKKEGEYTTPTTISSQTSGSSNDHISGLNYGQAIRANVYSSDSKNTQTIVQAGHTYKTHAFQENVVIKMFHTNKKAPDAYDVQIILANFIQKTR